MNILKRLLYIICLPLVFMMVLAMFTVGSLIFFVAKIPKWIITGQESEYDEYIADFTHKGFINKIVNTVEKLKG